MNSDNIVLESVVTPADGKENDSGTTKGGADLGSNCMPIASTSYVASLMVDDSVNTDSEGEVEEIYDETASFMAHMSFKINKVKMVVEWEIRACMKNGRRLMIKTRMMMMTLMIAF